ncbi:MAG: MBOAT family protein, partial [Clostridia bacterium]|nr:MBOAT family protein [Clostridia bacterium]
ILVSFVIFNANGMSAALLDIGGMFGAGDIPLWSGETSYYLSSYCVILACALFGATPILKNAVTKLRENFVANKVLNILEPIFNIVMLMVVTAYFVDGSFSPFLYFRF